jgi:hypothetical protein
MKTLFVAPALAFLLGLVALVLYRLLTGRIITRGLVLDPVTGEVSTIQIQNLLATLVGVATYAAAIGNHASPHEFPPVNLELLVLLGASNTLLVAGRGTANSLRNLLRSR